MIPVSKWKWFGNAGHFIGARDCRFHLCTQVDKFLISTVGEYFPTYELRKNDIELNKFEKENPWGKKIGCDRIFETMVFEAGKPCDRPSCHCRLPEISGSDLDFNGYNDRKAATEGHMEMCLKYATINQTQFLQQSKKEY